MERFKKEDGKLAAKQKQITELVWSLLYQSFDAVHFMIQQSGWMS